MRKTIYGVLVILVFLTLSSGAAAAEESVAAFTDVKNHWAAGDVEKCKAFKLMSGYPGNLFVPDRNMSRAEALTVIGRSLGWDRHPGNISTDGIKFPEDLWEGFSVYVAYAANNQLIVKEDIPVMKFNEPATRMEIVLWLAQALNLKGIGASLNFSDLGATSNTHRDMLAGVVEAGIIKGLPGNLFNPSGYLTRAEMAAILARLMENGKVSPISGQVLTGERGYVINKYRDYFTVHIDFGQVGKIQAADISFSINGNSTVYGSLRRGLPVELLKSGSVVTAVRILDGTPRVYGKVKVVKAGDIIIQDDEGNAAIYDINKRTKILDDNGAETDLAAVDPGMNVELSLDDYENVVVIRLHKKRLAEGRVEYIDLFGKNKITIMEAGSDRTYYLAEGIKVWDGSSMIQLADIKKDMNVKLVLNGEDLVIGVAVTDLATVEGKVASVNTTGISQIKILDRNGRVKMYLLAEGLKAREGSPTFELGDIKEGIDVRLSLDGNERVIGIEIIDMSTVVGEVSGIRTLDGKWILVKTDSGREEAYYVNSGVVVREGSNTRTLDLIKEGMRVKLALDILGNVTGIDVIGLRSVTGEIVNIETLETKELTVKDSNGRERAYYLDDGFVAVEGGKLLNVGDIKEGMHAKITMNSIDRVVRIEIKKLSTVEGKVNFSRTSGAVKIEIQKSNGLREAYYLDGGVTVKEGSITGSLSDVVKGMGVRLTVEERGDVTRIDIIEKVSVEGAVTGFSRREEDKIKIRTNNGQEETYYLDQGVVVREGDIGRERDSIFEGMRVGLVLDSKSRVTRIDILGSYTVRGKVTLIQTRDDKVIKIKGTDGTAKTYNVRSNVTINEGGSTRTLGDVWEGKSVELTLDSRLQISHIEIL